MNKSIWRKFIDWLVLSSANPQQAGATIQGILGGVVTAVIYFSPLLHLHVGPDQLNAIVDLIIQIFTACLGIVSAVVFILGAIRKIYLTWINPQ